MNRILQKIEHFYFELNESYKDTLYLMSLGTPICWDQGWGWGLGISTAKIAVGLSGGTVGLVSFVAFQFFAAYPRLAPSDKELAKEIIDYSWSLLTVGFETVAVTFLDFFPGIPEEEVEV